MFIQFFNGLSGLLGGYMLIKDPDGASLHMPLSWLNGTPFSNYLIPGIVLLILNGIGNLIGGSASLIKYRRAGEIAVFFGAIMMIWIFSQVSWIGYQGFMQPLYFVTGLVQLILGLWKIRQK